MPLLDVTQILNDADFASPFTVLRRLETVDSFGRSGVTETRMRAVGTITANSPSDLDRREDYQNMTRSITVVTRFPLRGETAGYQPDVILWQGSNYVVKHVDIYAHFGPGFFQVECSSMDKVDPSVIQNMLNLQTSFNTVANSQYLFLM